MIVVTNKEEKERNLIQSISVNLGENNPHFMEINLQFSSFRKEEPSFRKKEILSSFW